MNKGMVSTITWVVFLLLPLLAFSEGEIYKVVDKDGNVTFTDQRPGASAKPMDLPPLSVIETDVQTPASAGAVDPAATEPKELTVRELKKQFRDFRIIQPEQDQTFWGTQNTVVVTWGSSEPITPDMNVVLFVDGKSQQAPALGSVTLTLDRGEHTVYAELRSSNNRRIIATQPVTFFIKQATVNNVRRPARN